MRVKNGALLSQNATAAADFFHLIDWWKSVIQIASYFSHHQQLSDVLRAHDKILSIIQNVPKQRQSAFNLA